MRIIILFYVFILVPDEGLSVDWVWQRFVSVLSPGTHIMWFMLTLAGLYLITPILTPFVKNATEKELRIYLGIWFISLLLPWIPSLASLFESITGPLYYLSGYIGYFLLGYYIHTYRPNAAQYFYIIVTLSLIARYFYSIEEGKRATDLFWYLSIPVALMSMSWFSLVQKKRIAMGAKYNYIQLLSDCCFGIYLAHFFIMRQILWRFDFIIYSCGWIGQVVLTWLLTMLISFGYVISFLPGAEYIIGYRNKK